MIVVFLDNRTVTKTDTSIRMKSLTYVQISIWDGFYGLAFLFDQGNVIYLQNGCRYQLRTWGKKPPSCAVGLGFRHLHVASFEMRINNITSHQLSFLLPPAVRGMASFGTKGERDVWFTSYNLWGMSQSWIIYTS